MKKLLVIIVLSFVLNSSQINYSFSEAFWKSDSWKNIERMNRENRKHRSIKKELKELKKQTTSYQTLKYVGGDKYAGEYKYGKRNGQGTYTWADGQEAIKYTGEFKDNKMHGQGKLVYADGSIDEGEFKNGRFIESSYDNSNIDKKKATSKNFDSGDFTEKLKTLNELYKSGALTKSEFTKAKKKLLN